MQMLLPYQISFIASEPIVSSSHTASGGLSAVADWEWWPGWHSVSTTTLPTTTTTITAAVAVIISRLHTGVCLHSDTGDFCE